jgi:hypothetical protein
MKNEAVPMLLNGILINPQKEYAKHSISQVHHFLISKNISIQRISQVNHKMVQQEETA